jgi:hypothetical protein
MATSITHEVLKDVCVIHKLLLDITSADPLISLQTFDSSNTLLDAAKIRNHASILDLAESMTGEDIPRVFYNRKCRSVFTMKRDLEALKRKAESKLNDDAAATCLTKRQARRSSSEPCICEQNCIFCGKITCYKGISTREKLSKAIGLRAGETLRSAQM